MNELILYEKKLKKDDRRISLAVLSYFVVLFIKFMLIYIFGENYSEIIISISIIAQALIYIYSFPIILKRNFNLIFMLYILFLSYILIDLIIYPNKSEYTFNILFSLLFVSLPTYIYVFNIEFNEIFMKSMKDIGDILFYLSILFIIFILLGIISVDKYDMSLSYCLLFPLIIKTDKFFENIYFRNSFSVLFLLILILILGARGPILAFIVFSFLKLINKLKKLKKNEVLTLLILFVILILFILHADYYLLNMQKLGYEIFGFKSRTLELFLRDFNYSSGRDYIYSTLLKAIDKRPFLGYGISGDRMIMGSFAKYSHNIFLELIIQFGIIIGGSLIFILLFLITKGLLEKDNLKYNLFIIWLSLGFVPLLVSNSYLVAINFWILLALMIKNENLNIKKRRL